MNNTLLIGRTTRDPEVKYTGDGLAIARFTLAIDRPVKSKDGEKQADFPNIVCFGKTAENVEKYVVKGRLIAVQGRLQTGSYTNKDNVKVYTTEVVADRVQFLEWGEGENAPKKSNGSNNNGFEEIKDQDIPF